MPYSASHIGDPTAAQAPSPPPGRAIEPVGTIPIDGDPGNSGNEQQFRKTALDFIAWLTNHAAILDDGNPNYFTSPLIWQTGAMVDGDQRLGFGAPTDDRQKIAVFQQSAAAGAQFAYLYQIKESLGGGVELVINAVWNQAGPGWVRTTAAAAPAMLFRVRGSEIRIGYVDGTAATWADTAWTGYAGLVPYAPLLGAPGNGLQSEGPVLIARDAGGASWPTAKVTPGEIYRDFIPIGYYRALWTAAPAETVRCASNVKSVTRTGLGQYQIIFWPVVADPTIARVTRFRYSLVSGERIGTTVQDAGGANAGRIQVNVSLWNETAPGGGGALLQANIDDEFEIEVMCKP